jgi:ATP-binding cassette subfamily B protein
MAVIFSVIMRGAVPLSTRCRRRSIAQPRDWAKGLSGVRVIRAFDRGAWQRRRFDAANLDLTDTAIAVNR